MGKEIRILIITVRADVGGGPEHVYRLVTNLPDNAEVHIACPQEYPYWEKFVSVVGKANMRQIPHRRFTFTHLWKLVKYVRENSIEIIHSHGKGAGIYGRLAAFFTGRLCMHTYHGIHLGGYVPWQKRPYIFGERFLACYTDQLIAVSEGEAKFIDDLHLCSSDKLRVIKNGVVIPTEKRTGIRNFPVGKPRVYLVSRFNYQKNSALIMPILQCLKEKGEIARFEFHFLGDGEGRLILEKALADAGFGGDVVFHGNVAEINDYFRRAFCLLSTSRWEGMPLSVLEAMAFGVPVVATEVVGNSDIVNHGHSGFLYDVESPDAAAQYILQLAEDRELWRRFSAKAADIVREKYSVDRMAMDTYRTYVEIVHK